jgi:toxin YoeB
VKEIKREPFTGIGKPEPLKGPLSGWWSRRIDEELRLVYRVRDDIVEIAQAHGRYD